MFLHRKEIGRPFCLVFFLTLVMFMLGQDVFLATPDFLIFSATLLSEVCFCEILAELYCPLVIGIGLVVFLWGVVSVQLAG